MQARKLWFSLKWMIVPVSNFFGYRNVNNWEYKLFRLNLYYNQYYYFL